MPRESSVDYKMIRNSCPAELSVNTERDHYVDKEKAGECIQYLILTLGNQRKEFSLDPPLLHAGSSMLRSSNKTFLYQ